MYCPVTEALPLAQVLAVLNEKQAQDKRAELWQHYMANIVTMFAEEGTAKPYAEVLEAYDMALNANSEAELEEAYDNAAAVLRALEETRRG